MVNLKKGRRGESKFFNNSTLQGFQGRKTRKGMGG